MRAITRAPASAGFSSRALGMLTHCSRISSRPRTNGAGAGAGPSSRERSLARSRPSPPVAAAVPCQQRRHADRRVRRNAALRALERRERLRRRLAAPVRRGLLPGVVEAGEREAAQRLRVRHDLVQSERSGVAPLQQRGQPLLLGGGAGRKTQQPMVGHRRDSMRSARLHYN